MKQTFQTHSDVFKRIADAQPAFSSKMSQLADYVGAHYLKVAFMSTRELATAARVSPATVVRFPMLLGYADFDELRASIQDRLNSELNGVERFKTIPTTSRSSLGRLRQIIDADCENLRALAHTFSESQLRHFCDATLKADRVTIVGFRYVGALAEYFSYTLGKIKPRVEAWTRADSSLYDRVQLMDQRDVIIVLAFPRYPTDLLKLVRFASKLKITILAVTDSPLSPVLPLSQSALLAKASMLDFVGSLAAPAALINCVVSEIGIRIGKPALSRLEALETAASSAGIYESNGSKGARKRIVEFGLGNGSSPKSKIQSPKS
jgi:DNA-binding MurR/RpiR family transcriptional regulator